MNPDSVQDRLLLPRRRIERELRARFAGVVLMQGRRVKRTGNDGRAPVRFDDATPIVVAADDEPGTARAAPFTSTSKCPGARCEEERADLPKTRSPAQRLPDLAC